MTLSDVLAIALALAFTYALFSMFASAIKEAFAAVLQGRAKGLRGAIGEMLSLGDASGGGWERLADRVYGHALVAGVSKTETPSYVPARNFTLAVLDELSAGSSAPAATAIEAAVASLPDSPLKQRLNAYVSEAAGDVDALKSHLDSWFDDTMDRLSGNFKRHAQLLLFVIGAALAVALNVDTLTLFSTLLHEKAMAAQMAGLAQASHDAHQDDKTVAPGDVAAAISTLPLPIGWTVCQAGVSGAKADDADKGGGAGASAAQCDASKELVLTFDGYGLVVAPDKSIWGLIGKLIGWLLTALAISFGAPFWFDLVGQLVNFRSTGPKPPRADARAADAAS